jgi:hypothetical protein
MKTLRIFFIVTSFVMSVQSFAQNQIYTLLTIDDINIEPTFISESTLKFDNYNIKLLYKIGRFEIDKNDYKLLKEIASKSNNKEALLSFTMTNYCPKLDNINYNIQLNLSLFLEEYLLLKIYNFESYPNIFMKNTGYGFEYISPIISEVLPRKKKSKKNQCSSFSLNV